MIKKKRNESDAKITIKTIFRFLSEKECVLFGCKARITGLINDS